MWILSNVEFGRDFELCNTLGLVLNVISYSGLYDSESIQPSTSQSMTKVNLHALEQKVCDNTAFNNIYLILTISFS